MHPIHALWCHPRSVSTAFERVMRERGDLAVLHEPFMYHYYSGGRSFPGFEPDPDHPTGYDDIREMIRGRAADGPVFFKDMAYYVLDEIGRDAGFAREMTHAFLVRDPAEAVVSYARVDPEMSREEIGFEAQWRLYVTLCGFGIAPRVILSETLRRAPEATMAAYWEAAGLPPVPEALTWDRTVPEGWESVQAWHRKAITSGRIRAPEPPGKALRALEDLGEPYTGHAAHHRPFYEKLRAVAEEQAGTDGSGQVDRAG